MQREIGYEEWRRLQGSITKFWHRLTDEEVRRLDGSFESLAEKIQRRYHLHPRDAIAQINHFLDYFEPPTRH